MKPVVIATLLLGGIALLGGSAAETRENRPLKCRIGAARRAPAPVGPALVANVPRAMTPVSLDAVQMNDRVWKQVVVEGLFARRTPADTLEVMARIVNCTKAPLAIEVRSSFLDASQYPTEPTSVWRVVHIAPLSMATYQERSIGTTAVAHYLIELRSDQ
ncbi:MULTISPECIES: hypothetical protein [unclassified Sphingomonas]|uniref:hypothetical protein n=1 Tax=unclassified Sphingomonas TaxID=196159 RepID=UPI000ADE42B2|nr:MULTISPECIES: hypothetical protein [unclassified Sphingomonas]